MRRIERAFGALCDINRSIHYLDSSSDINGRLWSTTLWILCCSFTARLYWISMLFWRFVQVVWILLGCIRIEALFPHILLQYWGHEEANYIIVSLTMISNRCTLDELNRPAVHSKWTSTTATHIVSKAVMNCHMKANIEFRCVARLIFSETPSHAQVFTRYWIITLLWKPSPLSFLLDALPHLFRWCTRAQCIVRLDFSVLHIARLCLRTRVAQFCDPRVFDWIADVLPGYHFALCSARTFSCRLIFVRV